MDYKQLVPIWENYLKNKEKADYTSLYIHFPFCIKKCSFCMYDTLKYSIENSEQFLYEIEKQFKTASPIFKNEIIKTLYIGGGTPSLLTENQLQLLFNLVEKYFQIDPIDNMFNIEMHVSNITDNKIKILKNSFINRISIGVQSLNKLVLQKNNRVWTPENIVIEKFNKVYNYFDNVNIDLMHGLAGQTLNDIIHDITIFQKIKVPKITIYGYRNSMCFALRDGKIDNEGLKTRNIFDNIEYHSSFINDVKEIKKYILNDYEWYGTTDDHYNEYNYIGLKDHELSFKYSYVPEPIHYNNVISFGLGAYDSYFIPTEKMIHVNWFNDRIYVYDFYDPKFAEIAANSGYDLKEYLEWLYNNRNRINYDTFLKKRKEFS